MTFKSILKFISVAAVLLPCAAFGTESTAHSQTLIKNVLVFDGDHALGHRNVLIVDRKIADINFHGTAKSGTEVVDGNGKTLLPGLIDSHVHAWYYQELPLLFGVTTQLDMQNSMDNVRPVKQRMASGDNFDRSDLFSAGEFATPPGGHGTEFGRPIPTISRPEEADAFVTARIAEGSDYIKIVYDDESTLGHHVKKLSLPTLKALVAAAHKHGKLAVVHILDLASAEEAIKAGADGLAHLMIDKDGGEEFARLAKAHHVFIISTYTPHESFYGHPHAKELLATPEFENLLPKRAIFCLQQTSGEDHIKDLNKVMEANIHALRKAGVPILAGTDSGGPFGVMFGISLHRELELLVQAGMTPTEALRAATSRPANAFKLTDRGRIANGMKADLLLVKGDPTKDILATRNIEEVWKDGKPTAKLQAGQRAKIMAANEPIPLPKGGRIGSFEKKEGQVALGSPFGLGWETITDEVFGGASTVHLDLVDEAPDGQHALSITGELSPKFPYPFAGIKFTPGKEEDASGNLSNATALRFQARGDVGKYTLAVSSNWNRDAVDFELGSNWQEITIPFNSFKNFDPNAVDFISLVAGSRTGAFKYEIADVRLIEK